MRPLIDAAELVGRLHTVRVLDVRWSLADPAGGRLAHAESHIPGAVFLDVETDLSDGSMPDAGRHPLPDPDTLAARFGAAGIDDDTPVVVYDDSGGSVAARAWWLLRWLGHVDVAVLDGGWSAWVSGGHPVESGVPDSSPATFTLRPSLTRTVDRESVATRRGRLIDARAPERWRGDVEPVDPEPGHIPGAENVPTGELLDSTGRFLAPDVLATRLGPVDADTIASCGSGVTACAVILAAVAAGLPEPALYPGSYSEWVRAGLPVERG